MSNLKELIENFPRRISEKEKADFRKHITEKAQGLGYEVRCENCGLGNKNIIIGDPYRARVIFTAHYDTPHASPFPNLMLPRSLALFWLYQFIPLIMLLGISLGAGYLIGMVAFQRREVFFGVFLLLYYGLYFLFFRALPNKNNANDNTSGVATILEILDTPQGHSSNAAFILFDNEEKGKRGSKAYFRENKSHIKDKLFINFDCVGDGNNLIFIAMKAAEEREELSILRSCFTEGNGYSVHFFPSKGSEANSDHRVFPCGVGCMACRRSKRGIFYTPNIHTGRDTVARDENIEFIKNGVKKFISLLENKDDEPARESLSPVFSG